MRNDNQSKGPVRAERRRFCVRLSGLLLGLMPGALALRCSPKRSEALREAAFYRRLERPRRPV